MTNYSEGLRKITDLEKKGGSLHVYFGDGLKSIIPIDELSISFEEVNWESIKVQNSHSIVIQRKDGGEKKIPWDVARRFGDPEFARAQEREDIKTRLKLGKRLKKLRNEAGLTQIQLAKSAGVSRPTISRIENGANYPNTNTLRALSEALGLDFSEFLATTTKVKNKIRREKPGHTFQAGENEFNVSSAWKPFRVIRPEDKSLSSFLRYSSRVATQMGEDNENWVEEIEPEEVRSSSNEAEFSGGVHV